MNPKSASPSTISTPGVPKRRRKTQPADDDLVSRATVLDSPPQPRNPSPTTASSGGGSGGGASPGTGPGSGGASSSFRNVSACNRCRLRKNRCDQRLPACQSCEKAGVRCVGYDPITKREIPRSYVHYLETRVTYLESLLTTNNISFSPAKDFPDLPPIQTNSAALSAPSTTTATALYPPPLPLVASPTGLPIDPAIQESGRLSPLRVKRESSEGLEGKKLDSLVSDIGLVSFASASDPRYLGSVSGISFARVVFAAVKSTAPGAGGQNEQNGAETPKGRHRQVGSTSRGRGSRGLGMGGASTKDEPEAEAEVDADTQMRDSFFGLDMKPTISPAPFPSRPVAERLVRLYFEHANPQIPSLHRGEFAKVVDAIYGPVGGSTNAATDYGVQGVGLGGSARERYLLNIVCAIGAGIFLTVPEDSEPDPDDEGRTQERPRKKQKTDSKGHKDKPKQCEPESYHASAMLYHEAFLSQSKGGLDELQAVLLLAGYALLRPISPGLWYIVGVAVRLAVDLGLHYEDAEVEAKKTSATQEPKTEKEGKREWVRDMRRRLWWCVYNLDRLVSTCVGRPFGIADEVISTQFPSMLDDQYIHPTKGLIEPPLGEKVSYKKISDHYTRLRLLQSEILQVLQQQSHSFAFASASSETAFKRDMYKGKHNYPRHHPYHLQTPYLYGFNSLQAWHRDIDRRLTEWIGTAPKSSIETGVEFSPEFIELNYWQSKIMLYRPCLSIPVLLAGELGASSGNARSRAAERGLGECAHLAYGKVEDEERVYMVVAEAGSKVLRIYRQLHRVHQVNYTFLATHHLFMAGISFLYAIWHSPLVRSRLSMDEVDFTILSATSVLGDLVDVCPPAEACKEAFERMSRATVQMCLGDGKRGPTSTIVPSSTYQTTPSHRQPLGRGEQIKPEETSIHPQQYRPIYQSVPPSLAQSPQHLMMNQRSVSRSSSTDSYPQTAAAAARRQPIHFDDGFRGLFASSPHTPHISTPTSSFSLQQHHGYQSPTTPTEGMQYHSPAFAHAQHQPNIYPQPHAEMMIDPALQHTSPQYATNNASEWGHIDMTQFGIPEAEMWEHDSWSEEGNANQVDLFGGFFFGCGN